MDRDAARPGVPVPRRRLRSLEHRLQVGLGLGLVLLSLSLAGLLFSALQRLSDDYVLTRLQHDAESLLAAVDPGAGGEAPVLREARVASVYQRPFSGHYYLVGVDGRPRLWSRSLWDFTGELGYRAVAVGAEQHWRHSGPDGQQVLVWAAAYRKQGHVVTVLVAEDTAPLARALSDYGLQLAVLAVVATLALLLLQRHLLRRAFAPLRSIGDELARLERGKVSALQIAVPAEVAPLVAAVNRLLTLTGQRLARSRNALGNLSHALKRPLILLQQLADDPRLRDRADVAAELRARGDELNRLVDHELRRARLAGAGRPGHFFDPALELPALATLIERLYPEKRLEVECAFPEGVLPELDRDDILELLGNLLENAAKWAARRVRCRITAATAFTISVEDDGPGVAEEMLGELTRRGGRLDEDVPGYGLGLAIVNDIVGLYGGSLGFDRSPELGGLRVSVTLPCAA